MTAGTVVYDLGGEPEWSHDAGPTIADGHATPRAMRSWCWDAQSLAFHYWRTWTVSSTRKLRGWVGAGRLSTLRWAGTRYTYSVSRWRAEDGSPWTHDRLADHAREVEELCRRLGVAVKGSPGSVASALYSRIARSVYVAPEAAEFLRAACYGGRAEAWTTGVLPIRVCQWDRRSAYVAELLRPLPDPRSLRWVDRARMTDDGVAVADVEARPEWVRSGVPVLPVRARTVSGDRTLYAWGKWRAPYAIEELRAARDRGYRVRLREGVTFGSLSVREPLAEFARRVWAARSTSSLAKVVGVALIGRLHSGRTTVRVEPLHVGPGETVDDVAERTGLPPRRLILGHGGAFGRTGPDVAVWEQVSSVPSPWVDPGAAAYVLARARLGLLELAEAQPERVVALGTDGAILRGWEPPRGLDLGDELGQWREDGRAELAEVWGPLHYRLASSSGETKIRCAGIGRECVDSFLRGQRVRWRDVDLIPELDRTRRGEPASVTGGRLAGGRIPWVEVVDGKAVAV